MNISAKLSKQYEVLRENIINEIMSFVEKHDDLSMGIELDEDVVYAYGVDEQEQPQMIKDITRNEKVTIYHYGDFVGEDYLTNLSTATLLNVLKGVEESYNIGANQK